MDSGTSPEAIHYTIAPPLPRPPLITRGSASSRPTIRSSRSTTKAPLRPTTPTRRQRSSTIRPSGSISGHIHHLPTTPRRRTTTSSTRTHASWVAGSWFTTVATSPSCSAGVGKLQNLRLARPVGPHRPDQHSVLHHDRQQRHRRRGMDHSAYTGPAAAAPGVIWTASTSIRGPTPWNQSRCVDYQSRTGRQRHRHCRHEPFRLAQPDA